MAAKKRYRDFLTFAGATSVLVTFLVNDYKKENAKESKDSISSVAAYPSFEAEARKQREGAERNFRFWRYISYLCYFVGWLSINFLDILTPWRNRLRGHGKIRLTRRIENFVGIC